MHGAKQLQEKIKTTQLKILGTSCKTVPKYIIRGTDSYHHSVTLKHVSTQLLNPTTKLKLSKL